MRWNLVYTHFSLLMLTFSLATYAQKLEIGIFNQTQLKSLALSVMQGDYVVSTNNEILATLDTNEILYVTFTGKGFDIRSKKEFLINTKEIEIKSIRPDAFIKISPLSTNQNSRIYKGDLNIATDYTKLKLILSINIDDYLAGVVETEVGIGRSLEFYKAHAVIARTYAIKHFTKHIGEGFHLCDGVHCQAIKKFCSEPKIKQAIVETNNEVIRERDTNLITAVFHANCGGQTANSEDVWLVSLPYLRSVRDPYCTSSKQAQWEKSISIDKWKQYLRNQGFSVGNIGDQELSSISTSRKKYYVIRNDSLKLSIIRTDWNLKSSYFNIKAEGNEIHFAGKGYGHGVGLCQEGAMRMAELGSDYKEILSFYYKNVEIVNVKNLKLQFNNYFPLTNEYGE